MPNPVHTPPIEQLDDVTKGYVPKTTKLELYDVTGKDITSRALTPLISDLAAAHNFFSNSNQRQLIDCPNLKFLVSYTCKTHRV